MVTGIETDAVIELVLDRLQSGRTTPSERKLGLVVEGGAMRGTYTGGSLLALHLLGASSIFDKAYATSAGAINAAHFLSGVGHLKAATYYKALADGRFFNPRRLHRIVDVDFVIDVVLRHEIPLEVDRLAATQTPLEVALLECSSGKAEMKALDWSRGDAWDTLKAAVAMPVVYNRRIPIGAGDYVDGGMAIPYPLQAAIDDGMTDIVVLLTQNPSQPVRPRGLSQRLLWWLLFARGRPALVRVFDGWHETVSTLNAMASGKRPRLGGPRILTIAPTAPKVSSSTMDQVLLRDGCLEMANEVLDLFGSSRHPLDRLVDQGVV